MKKQTLSQKIGWELPSILTLIFFFLLFSKNIVVQAETEILKNGGIYYIETKCAPGKVLDFKSQSTADSAIVHIWKNLSQ